MGKFITYVGLDVHKKSIDVALADSNREGEVRHYGSSKADLSSIDKFVCKLIARGSQPRFVYKAGPCGYEIYQHLRRQGLECMVAAPSLIPQKSGDRIKNDRRDAMMLARLHRAGELAPVYVPRSADEAMRDLSRAREDAKRAERKAVSNSMPFCSATVSPTTAKASEPGSLALDFRY